MDRYVKYNLNKVFLNFADSEAERLYEKFAFKNDRLSFRVLSIAALVINVLVFFVDWNRAGDWQGPLLVRGCLILSLLSGLVATFFVVEKKPALLQLVIFVILLLFVLCLITGMSIVPFPDFALPNSIATSIFFSISISGLRYRYALVYLLIVFFSYILLISYFAQNEFWSSQIIAITVNSLIGITASYIIEKSKRKNFTTNEIVASQNKELESVNEIKNRVFSILSHDLRSPINKLITMVGLLKKNHVRKDEFEEYAHKLGNELMNTSSFMENMLYWSKNLMSGSKNRTQNLNLKENIDQNLKAFVEDIKLKKIEIKNLVSESVTLYSDEDTVNMSLRNLISNAIKFTPENGKVEIGFVEQDDFKELYVSDTGCGIASDKLEDLFTLKTISSVGTSGEKGTGLGLYLLKEFIQKNGGNISCESELGKGAIFRVTLPNENLEESA